jgi:hypothetical protein
MKKVIRLTEKDLTNLIKKIVMEETSKSMYEGELNRKGKSMDMGMEMFEDEDEFDFEETDTESDYGKMSKEKVIDAIEDVVNNKLGRKLRSLSHDEIMSMIENLERVENKLESREMRTGEEMTFGDFINQIKKERRGRNTEMSEDLDARKSNMLKKAKIVGGVGLTAAGILAMMSQGTTYTEWGPTFIAIHDAVANLGDYAPNIGLGAVVGGLATILNGIAQDKKEEELKENYRRRKYNR